MKKDQAPKAHCKYSPGVEKLERFVSEAAETFSQTEMVQNDVIDLCKVSTIIRDFCFFF
jgi:hypothetical protein